MNRSAHVVILGGGFAGAACARRLSRRAPGDCAVTVLDRHNYLLFYPLLVEAGTGSIEPRHATVPLRVLLPPGSFRMGDVSEVDVKRSTVTYRVAGESRLVTTGYDHLVMALGSVTNLPPVPGLAEFGFTMKSLADAVSLRDRMLQLLERADAEDDPARRRRLLHVLVVGGNFTGVEVAGEYMHLLKTASRLYPRVDPSDIRVTLVERLDRILTALDEDLAAYAARVMENRGIRFLLQDSVREIRPDHAILSSGRRLECGTVIWCAGIAPNPVIRRMNLPTDKAGWLLCDRDGRVKGHANVWGIGDCAVNIQSGGRPYPPTAQSAEGEGKAVADNIAASIRGSLTGAIRFRIRGSVTPLGGHNAVVMIGRRQFSGPLAWFIYRTYYFFKIPGIARKARVGLDWLGAMFTAGDAVQLGLHARRASPLPERRGYDEPSPAGNGHKARKKG